MKKCAGILNVQIQRLQDKIYRPTNGVVLACICAHTWSPLLKKTMTSSPQSIFFAFITGAVKSDAVSQIAARKPTCSLILARTVFQIPLGGSKHFLAFFSNLTSLERKIFQRVVSTLDSNKLPPVPLRSSSIRFPPNSPEGTIPNTMSRL